MMLKALPLVHFWSILLLKEQMTTSVRKMLKSLVWTAQNRSISVKFASKITTKLAVFYQLLFGEVCPKTFHEIGQFFREFVPKNPAKFDFFSATYQKSWLWQGIVNGGDWLWSPANIKGANKDAKIYVRRSTTLHNLLFCVHTLCMNYVTSTFLLVSSSVRSKQLLCFVQGQGQKREQKHTTKNFVGFHNHSLY